MPKSRVRAREGKTTKTRDLVGALNDCLEALDVMDQRLQKLEKFTELVIKKRLAETELRILYAFDILKFERMVRGGLIVEGAPQTEVKTLMERYIADRPAFLQALTETGHAYLQEKLREQGLQAGAADASGQPRRDDGGSGEPAAGPGSRVPDAASDPDAVPHDPAPSHP